MKESFQFLLPAEIFIALDQTHIAKVLNPLKVFDVIGDNCDASTPCRASYEHIIGNPVLLFGRYSGNQPGLR